MTQEEKQFLSDFMEMIKEAAENGSPEAAQWLEEEAEKGNLRALEAIQEINLAAEEEEVSSQGYRAPKQSGKSKLWEILNSRSYGKLLVNIIWIILILIGLWLKFKK